MLHSDNLPQVWSGISIRHMYVLHISVMCLFVSSWRMLAYYSLTHFLTQISVRYWKHIRRRNSCPDFFHVWNVWRWIYYYQTSIVVLWYTTAFTVWWPVIYACLACRMFLQDYAVYCQTPVVTVCKIKQMLFSIFGDNVSPTYQMLVAC